MPQVAGPVLCPDDGFFERRDSLYRPHTDQAGRFISVAAADLDSQAEHLGKEDAYQDAYVAITV
jgi:hypothetical protein